MQNVDVSQLSHGHVHFHANRYSLLDPRHEPFRGLQSEKMIDVFLNQVQQIGIGIDLFRDQITQVDYQEAKQKLQSLKGRIMILRDGAHNTKLNIFRGLFLPPNKCDRYGERPIEKKL